MIQLQQRLFEQINRGVRHIIRVMRSMNEVKKKARGKLLGNVEVVLIHGGRGDNKECFHSLARKLGLAIMPVLTIISANFLRTL
jgi:hypothetical protein